MSLPSMSNTTPKRDRPWLEQHYQATRERTVQLVKVAVDRLVKDGRAVTIDAICQMSQQLDPQGKGIKKAGILGNEKAYAYYQQYSVSLRRTPQRSLRQSPPTSYRLPTELSRDVGQVRRRYSRERKASLVERLLSVEQAYMETQQQLAHLQFELLEYQQKMQKG